MERTEIHNLINSPNTPLAIKELLKKFITEFDNQNSSAWCLNVLSKDKKHHCYSLLNKGSGVISQAHNKSDKELSKDELICLYNYYYFPILFESTYLIYSELWDGTFEVAFASDNALVFMDFGSSTLPVSLAFSEVFKNNKPTTFWEAPEDLNPIKSSIWKEQNLSDFPIVSYFFRDSDFNYYAEDFIKHIDRSADWDMYFNILETGVSDLFPPLFNVVYPRNSSWFLDNFTFSYGRHKLNIELGDISFNYINNVKKIQENSWIYYTPEPFQELFNQNKSIILNINYFRSLSNFNFEKMIEEVNDILKENKRNNVAILFQNNGNEELQNKWDIFKSGVSMKSIKSGVINLTCNTKIQISYEVLFRSKYERYNYY